VVPFVPKVVGKAPIGSDGENQQKCRARARAGHEHSLISLMGSVTSNRSPHFTGARRLQKNAMQAPGVGSGSST
jgi:hypothetical protein